MNSIHKKRLTFFSLLIFGIALGTSLILFALKQNINVYLTPTELTEKKIAKDYHIRLGGMVKKGSIEHDKSSLAIRFIVTDFNHDIPIQFAGVLPDLFREGKGVIATGKMNENGIFMANEILAKHDENYMPKKLPASLSLNEKASTS